MAKYILGIDYLDDYDGHLCGYSLISLHSTKDGACKAANEYIKEHDYSSQELFVPDDRKSYIQYVSNDMEYNAVFICEIDEQP